MVPASQVKVNLLSKYTYSWLTEFVLRGYKECYRADDAIYDLGEKLESEQIIQQLEQGWSKLQEQNEENVLERGLRSTFGIPLIMSGILLLLAEVCSQLTPFALQVLLVAMENQNARFFGYGSCIALLALPAVKSLLSNQSMLVALVVGLKCRTAMIGMIFSQMMNISSDLRAKYSVSKCVGLVSNDAAKIEAFFNYIHCIWMTPVQMALTALMLWFLLGWGAVAGAFVLIAVLPLQFGIVHLLARIKEDVNVLTDRRIRLFQEMLSSARVIKFYALETIFVERLEKLRLAELKRIRLFNLASGLSFVLTVFFPAAASIVGFGVYVWLGHVLTADVVFAALSYFNMLEIPLANVPMAINSTISARSALSRIDRFLMHPQKPPPTQMTLNSDLAVIVEKASFEWDIQLLPHPQPQNVKKTKKKGEGGSKSRLAKEKSEGFVSWKSTLKEHNLPVDSSTLFNIGMQIKKGLLVAVVGPVGSGKSSLLAALLGEMHLLDGSFTINGRVAYSPQQAWILNGTVRENIIFGRSLDELRYWTCIRQCAMETDLENLPQADLTEIGERGVSLSGGQKARINLARAVYADTDVVLMDDPMAAVDGRVRNSLFHRCIYNGLLRDKTRILVTNHLAVLPYADHVIIMKDGTIIEQGSYEWLVSNRPSFAELMSKHLGEEGEEQEEEEEEEEQEPEENILMSRTGSQLIPKSKMVSIYDQTSALAYKRYIYLAGGLLFATSAILTTSIHETIRVGKDIWLVMWTDRSINGFSERTYLYVYAGMGGSLLLSSWACVLVYLFGGYVASKVLHSKAAKAVFASPMRFFEATPVGRILNRFSRDMDVVDNQLSDELNFFVYAIISLVSTLLVMFYASWLAGLLLIPPLIVSILLQILYRRCGQRLQAIQAKAWAAISSHFSETYSGLCVIKAFNDQSMFSEKLHDLLDKHNRVSYISMILRRWTGLRSEFVGAVLLFSVSLVCFIFNVGASFTGLVLSSLLNFAISLDWFVKQFADTEISMQSVDRLCHYAFELPSECYDPPNAIIPSPSWPSGGRVSFCNYTVSYIPGTVPILHEITATINPGEKVAIVGRTGAGKSTLLACLFSQGYIDIDGIDISKIPLKFLRSHLTVVPQEPVIFAGTIRFNVDPSGYYTDSDIWNVIDRVGLRSCVEYLEHGLDSELQDFGLNISLGERQLICLARALLHRSKVVILDEPTASVDLETDEKIQETLWDNLETCTVITITHRLNYITDFDRVMVLEAGRIVEFDSPAKLLEDPDSYLTDMLATVNPRPFLLELTGQKVIVQLKWGVEYHGTLVSIDSYMNIQLADTEEFVDDESAGKLGDIIVRCNNVLLVRAARTD